MNIVWQNNTVSEQLRQQIQQLNEMLVVTRSTQMDKEARMEAFMKSASESLNEFAAKVEEEFGKEKVHIQTCLDAWVGKFTDEEKSWTRKRLVRMPDGTWVRIGRLRRVKYID